MRAFRSYIDFGLHSETGDFIQQLNPRACAWGSVLWSGALPKVIHFVSNLKIKKLCLFICVCVPLCLQCGAISKSGKPRGQTGSTRDHPNAASVS